MKLRVLILVLSALTSFGHEISDDFYQECSNTKGCFGFPGDCITAKNCKIAVSYQGISEDQYNFEILGKQIEGKRYIAFGLSLSGAMPQSSVVACFIDDSQPHIEMYWNTPAKDSLPLEDTDLGLSNTNITVSNDYILCQFTRDALTEFTTPEVKPKNVTVDLNSNEYTLLLSYGRINDEDRLIYHTDRDLSASPVDLSIYNPHLLNSIKEGRTSAPIAIDDYFTSVDTPIDFYNGCSETKGCQGYPDGCIESKNCSIATSYQGISEDNYNFEILGQYTKNNQYIASGLSFSGQMFESSVVACFEKNNVPSVEMYWNLAGERESLPLSNPSLGITNSSIVVSDGQMLCKFTRDSSTSFTTPGSDPKNVTVDINKEKFTLLFAHGYLLDFNTLTEHTTKGKTLKTIAIYDYNPFVTKPNDFYNGCSETKGCQGVPAGCIESKNCSIATSYRGISKDKYEFEIFGEYTADNQYIASGLSFSDRMANASVVVCFQKNNVPSVEMYWNLAGQRDSLPLSNPSLGISNSSIVVSDGQMLCKFTRDSSTSFTTPGSEPKYVTVDINAEKFTLLFAHGDLSSNFTLTKHTNKGRTGEPIPLFEFNPFLPKDVYDGCGINKGCFGFPNDCEKTHNCSVVSTYNKAANGDINLQISGRAKEDSYLAVGLANAAKMFSASVMVCYNFGTEKGVAMSWNEAEGKRNSLILENPTLGLKDVKVIFEDGILTCSLTRDKITEIKIPNQEKTVTFDLANKYYMLLAKGTLNPKRKIDNSEINFVLTYHNEGETASSEPVDLTSFSQVSASKNQAAMWHGSLMSIAWLFFACTGTMTARYGRQIPKKIMGKDIWFRIHQTCMGLTWLLSIGAIIALLVDRGVEPLTMDQLSKNGHAAVGLTAFVLAFIQPFMAYFRPHPGTSKRPIFNYAHLSVGMSAILLAFVALGLATRFPTLEISDGKYLVGVFGGFYIAFHILLSLHSWRVGQFGKAVLVFIALFAIGALTSAVTMIVLIAK